MEKKKYYNVNVTNSITETALRLLLREKSIYFETSGFDGGVHFEMLMDPYEATEIENALDALYAAGGRY